MLITCYKINTIIFAFTANTYSLIKSNKNVVGGCWNLGTTIYDSECHDRNTSRS